MKKVLCNYHTKNEFIDLLFSDKKLEEETNVIQTRSNSCLTKKNKAIFQSTKYLEPALNLNREDLERLQLPGYKLSDNLEVIASIKKSVNKIGCFLTKQLSVIKNHTSYLALVEPLSKSQINIISATTFYDYPFCTFFTKYGLFFMQPNIVFSEPNDYVIFDNIYHEALHQELLIQILLDKIFINYRRIPKDPIIPVPWRNTQWTLEHALQAFYVYRHLFYARLLYAQSGEHGGTSENIKIAIQASKKNSEHLYLKLMNLKDIFTTNGLNLLKSLMFESEIQNLSLANC